jgi:hypothetical protein
VLGAVGEEALAQFISPRVIRAAGPDILRGRLHYEMKRWRHADAHVDFDARTMSGLLGAARKRLAEYQQVATAAGDAGVPGRGGEKNARPRAYLLQVVQVADAGYEVARLIGWEVSVLQFGVSECAPMLGHEMEPPAGDVPDRLAGQDRAPVQNRAEALARGRRGGVVAGGVVPGPAWGGGGSTRVGDRLAAADDVLQATRGLVEEMGQCLDALRAFQPTLRAGGGGGVAQHPPFSLLTER